MYSLAQHLQHTGAGQAHERGGEVPPQGDAGQDQVGKSPLAGHRQQVEVQPEHDEKHQGQPEIGNGQPKQGDCLPQAVPPGVQLDRRQDVPRVFRQPWAKIRAPAASWSDAVNRWKYSSRTGRLNWNDWPMSPLKILPHEGEILFGIGLVQAPLGPQPGQVFLPGARLGIQPRRVSARYPHQAEDGNADYQKGNDAVD